MAEAIASAILLSQNGTFQKQDESRLPCPRPTKNLRTGYEGSLDGLPSIERRGRVGIHVTKEFDGLPLKNDLCQSIDELPFIFLPMSHIASIGFDAPSEEEFRAMVQRFLSGRKGEPFFTETDQSYLAIPDASGAQLWIQLSEQKAILGFRPHFHGNAKMKVTVVDSEPQEGTLSGVWTGFCNPNGAKDAEKEGLYKLSFDCPDYLSFVPPMQPWHSTLQIAAFAERLEFAPWSAGDSLQLSPMLKSTKGEEQQPSPMVRLKGKVVDAEELTNGLTDQAFCHALVTTLGGEVDLVWPIGLMDELPKPGMAVKAQAWLSGRFSERPRLRGRGLRGLLFGRR
jgi:hypothetical protein